MSRHLDKWIFTVKALLIAQVNFTLLLKKATDNILRKASKISSDNTIKAVGDFLKIH